MNAEAEARYELSRLQELLADLPFLLRTLGIGGDGAGQLTADAADLGRRLLAERQAHHARRAPACALS